MSFNPNGKTAMFVLEGVNKSYPGVVALHSLSLTIQRGERIAVVGPSGSGKTTLLHLLGGVIQPDEGRVHIDDQLMTNLSSGRELASMVGLIHQQFDLVPRLSVAHNVMAGRLGYWSFWRSLLSLVTLQEKQLAVAALQRTGIQHKLNERVSRLSGGEQQRVAIARLLVQHPQAIIADEPVASLDPSRSEDIMRLLRDIAEESGKTLIASLHSLDLVRAHFSRVFGLRSGHVSFDVSVSQLSNEMLTALYDLEERRDDVLASVF